MKNFFLLTTSLFFVACEQTRSLRIFTSKIHKLLEKGLWNVAKNLSSVKIALMPIRSVFQKVKKEMLAKKAV